MNLSDSMEELRSDLIDLVVESQIKLGQAKSSVRFYYPLESLNRLFDTSFSAEEMENALGAFSDICRDTLGSVEVTRTENRFCFTIPAEGAKWAEREYGQNGFLTDFIAEIAKPGSCMKKLLPVFEKYSSKVVCKPVVHDEFDYLVYFEDGEPDAYRYCIHEDLGHATYHRFTKKDYDAFEIG